MTKYRAVSVVLMSILIAAVIVLCANMIVMGKKFEDGKYELET